MSKAGEQPAFSPASAAVSTETARTLWCPFVRELGDDGASYNRGYKGQVVGHCVGDRCMAWRWSEEDTDMGFCGLAGRPEVRA